MGLASATQEAALASGEGNDDCAGVSVVGTHQVTPGHKKVCNGTLTLRQAQKLELAYKRKYG